MDPKRHNKSWTTVPIVKNCAGKILDELSIFEAMNIFRYLFEGMPDLAIYCRDSLDDELGVCDVVDQIICSHKQVGLSN